MKDFKITTKRLTLVPLGLKYLDDVFEYARDLENTRYMINLPSDDINDTISFLEYVEGNWNSDVPSAYECAILLGETFIGTVSLTLEENNSAEFGWILKKKHWGHGYMIEAASALKEYAINTLGIRKFIAHCDARNSGSYGVMERLGMTLKDSYGGRKNKCSDEECTELLYELVIE